MFANFPGRPAEILAFAAALLLGACAERDDAQGRESSGPPIVYTDAYHLHYFAERIGGDKIQAAFPAPDGLNPSRWRPGDDIIERYQNADLILRSGASYAIWTRFASLPLARTHDTSRAYADRIIVIENAITHSHGPDGMHSHDGESPYTWLDPTLAIEQARAVKTALIGLLPENEAELRARFETLQTELSELDREIASIVSDRADAVFATSHPVYHYFVRRYGLDAHDFHWEPDEMPDAEEWAALDALLGERSGRIMLWEDEVIPEIASELRERGVIVAVVRIVDRRPPSGDFVSIMRENAESIRGAFEAFGSR